MDSQRYIDALELELHGSIEEAGRKLRELALEGHPLALIELGIRHLVDPIDDPEHYCPDRDEKQSALLIEAGRQGLLALAETGDGEAMRQLAYFNLGLLGLHDGRSVPQAETWLRKSFESGCHFAANDLYSFYRGRDVVEARHWLAEAKKYGCLVVAHDREDT